jgi:hypothetical protein
MPRVAVEALPQHSLNGFVLTKSMMRISSKYPIGFDILWESFATYAAFDITCAGPLVCTIRR